MNKREKRKGRRIYPHTGLDRAVHLLKKLYFPSLAQRRGFNDLTFIYWRMISDFAFFKMICWALASFPCDESHYDWHLCFAINNLMSQLRQTVSEMDADLKSIVHQKQRPNFEVIIHDLDDKIQQLKIHVKEICVLVLSADAGFKCNKSCGHSPNLFINQQGTTQTPSSFIDLVLSNLDSLLHRPYYDDLITPVKQQISFISPKIKEFSKWEKPANVLLKIKNLSGPISVAQTWFKHISFLVCLCWINGKDQRLVSTWAGLASNYSVVPDLMMMYKAMPYTPGIVASYFEDSMIPQILGSYFDSLLESCLVVVPTKNVEVETLREGLIFSLSFVTDPPDDDDEGGVINILEQIYETINALPPLIRSLNKFASNANFLCFLQKIDVVKAKVREVYFAETQHYSSQLNPPKTDVVGFLDSLLDNLKKMLEEKLDLTPSVKLQVEAAQKELALLRSNICSLQNYGECKDLWTRTIDVVYYAAHVSDLCLPKSCSIWYGFICLPNVIQELKLLNGEIQKKIGDLQMCRSKTLSSAEIESNSVVTRRLKDATPEMNKEAFVVGFKKDAESIIESLTRGSMNRTIISISGSPGRGKTTLAKKIYNDQNIQCYFHKTAWCYVSKECTARDLLIKIGSGLIDDKARELPFEDLAQQLWKHLKRKRYLIVMDDIWDVDVWNQVQLCFPDDENGSRILFTTRNDDVVSKIPKSVLYPLELLSEQESFGLIKEKLFDGTPPEFMKVAEQIASHCKGLALAIVLMASLLGKTEQRLDLWNEIAENLKSHLTSEGCGNIIELSYKYLPDHLKSCFLYFGAFRRGTNIMANKLKRLWISEGFIKKSPDEGLSSEDLANQYLDNLVSQNLVSVEERSSMGGIKSCNVHDLLYDLCLQKANEENFLNWASDESLVNRSWSSSPPPPQQKYSHHRLCIGRSVDPFIKPKPLFTTRKELLTSQVHSCLCGNDRWNCITLESISWFLQSFKVLKVLDLEGVELHCEEIPKCILSMVHLTYLALNFWTSILSVSSSIADLWKLETLILKPRKCGSQPPVVLFSMFKKMKYLRHIDLSPFKLTLRIKDVKDDNSFAWINIETLGTLYLSYDYDVALATFLRKLPRLRKLCCYLGSDKALRKWLSMLRSLGQLESLLVKSTLPAFKGLTFPPIPVMFPMNLRKLTLEQLYLPWSAISTIGMQLSNLEVLKLLEGSCEENTWILEDGLFSKLRYLKLESLMIMEIDVSCCEEVPFPCLEHLVVEDCPLMEEIPSIFGEIYTLKTIKMIEASREAAESVWNILQDQRDLGNQDLQVFVSL